MPNPAKAKAKYEAAKIEKTGEKYCMILWALMS